MNEQDRQYHTKRARQEIDLAFRAERREVAEAHMKLSACHMRQLARTDSAHVAEQDAPASSLPRPSH